MSSSIARPELRRLLLAKRAEWLTTPAAHAAGEALTRSLHRVLEQLEPLCLGLYWPLEGEFNAAAALQPHSEQLDCTLALPFAYKSPRRMEYRAWDGGTPQTQDECGIAASPGRPVQPDVVLVPCVGFSAEGYRIGYGGGYFDRWLAEHPGVTAVGIAFEISRAEFAVEAHDQPLSIIVTEREVLAP